MSFNFEQNTFHEMSNFFHKFGYIKIDNAISPDVILSLKNDLYGLENNIKNSKKKKMFKIKDGELLRHKVYKCFFEKSSTMVDIIESSKLSDFAQFVINDVPNSHPGGTSLQAHVIHNNAFIVPPNGRGQAPSWHVDDPLQQVIIPQGTTLPDNIRLPVLVATYMIWLSDCESSNNGPTFVVPGSHRFGCLIDKDLAETNAIPMCGKAGTAVLINCNLWHRGSHNSSNVPRDTLQVTFARRIIGHKFKTIMNYMMPNNVLRDRNDIAHKRLGFLEGGAYS